MVGGGPMAPPDNQVHSMTPTRVSQPSQIYSAAASKHAISASRLTPVPLAHRPIFYVDNIPTVLLTPVEENKLCR